MTAAVEYARPEQGQADTIAGGLTALGRIAFGADEALDVASILQMLAAGGRTGTVILARQDRWATLEMVNGRLAGGDSRRQALATELPTGYAAVRASIQAALADVLEWPSGGLTLVPARSGSDGPTFDLGMLLIETVAAQDERRHQAEGDDHSASGAVREPVGDDLASARPSLATAVRSRLSTIQEKVAGLSASPWQRALAATPSQFSRR